MITLRFAAALLVAVPSAAFAAGSAPAVPASPQVKVEVIRAGNGGKPPAHSYVLVSYKGMLTNGTVFDKNMWMPMALDQVVPGFAQGLMQMERGGRYRMTIPSELAYGAQASGPIPANSTLVFEVDLLDFRTAEEIAAIVAERQAEEAAKAAVQPAQ